MTDRNHTQLLNIFLFRKNSTWGQFCISERQRERELFLLKGLKTKSAMLKAELDGRDEKRSSEKSRSSSSLLNSLFTFQIPQRPHFLNNPFSQAQRPHSLNNPFSQALVPHNKYFQMSFLPYMIEKRRGKVRQRVTSRKLWLNFMSHWEIPSLFPSRAKSSLPKEPSVTWSSLKNLGFPIHASTEIILVNVTNGLNTKFIAY